VLLGVFFLVVVGLKVKAGGFAMGVVLGFCGYLFPFCFYIFFFFFLIKLDITYQKKKKVSRTARRWWSLSFFLSTLYL